MEPLNATAARRNRCSRKGYVVDESTVWIVMIATGLTLLLVAWIIGVVGARREARWARREELRLRRRLEQRRNTSER